MFAVRQYEEIRSAALPEREMIPQAGLDAYDGLVAVWLMNPYEDLDAFYAKATNVVAIADAIYTVAALATTFDYALALESNDAEGWITNNDISGYVALHYNQDQKLSPLSWASTASEEHQNNKVGWAKDGLPDSLLAKRLICCK